MPTETTPNEPLRSGRLFDLPTSEMPTPSFLRRRDDWVQPSVANFRAAERRCHSRLNRDAAMSALRTAMSWRDQSFVGFRGDLWRDWRSGMREKALEWRQLSGENRFTLTQGRPNKPSDDLPCSGQV